MSLGQSDDRQLELWVAADELPQATGSPFYQKLNRLLAEAKFDREVEALCEPHYKDGGRPSIPPGRYFRMLLIGYFEGIGSQRGIAWRCADSLALREFLGCPLNAEKPRDRQTPDHSSLTRIRDRLPFDVHERAFLLILKIASEKKILQGKTLLVDSTLLEANASMKKIVRKVSRESWNEYIKRLAEAEGIENPTDEDARRLDRKRKGKKVSNAEWESSTDRDARIARMKDGSTHLAYKAEHAADAASGLIVSAGIEHADGGESSDSETIKKRILEAAAAQLLIGEGAVVTKEGQVVTQGRHVVLKEVVADAGYHKDETLAFLETAQVRSYIAEKDEPHRRKWTDKPEGFQQAHYANRRRVKGARGKALLRKRGERIERSFAHSCETGGGRRMWLRGLEKAGKRWLGLLMGLNLGIIMRALFRIGTSRSLQGGGPLREAAHPLSSAAQRRLAALPNAIFALWRALNEFFLRPSEKRRAILALQQTSRWKAA